MFRRSFVVCLGLLLGLSSSSFNSYGLDSGKFRGFVQTDPLWSESTIGDSQSSMGRSGCLVTAVSMVMAYANEGYRDDSVWNPGVACKKLGFEDDLLLWYSVENVDPTFTFQGKIYESTDKPLEKNKAYSLVKRCLDEGYYVVVGTYSMYTPGKSHYTAITGKDADGNPLLFDVASNKNSSFDYWAEHGIYEVCLFSSSSKPANETLEGYYISPEEVAEMERVEAINSAIKDKTVEEKYSNLYKKFVDTSSSGIVENTKKKHSTKNMVLDILNSFLGSD